MIDGQGMKLIEPLRELFKDEVRALGRELGIAHELVMRHPFPGPGIAIRVLGEVTPERVEIARKADHIFISMIREAGLYDKISQAYAALDPTKAVGVMVSQPPTCIWSKLSRRLSLIRAINASTPKSSSCAPSKLPTVSITRPPTPIPFPVDKG